VTLQGAQPAPLIAADRTLEQALLNLLDNAADANGSSPEALRFFAGWDAGQLLIEILDRGNGLDAATAQRLGEAFFSTKVDAQDRPRGIGIGLFLSNATIERCGGKVELFNRDDPPGGACTRVTLPLTPPESLMPCLATPETNQADDERSTLLLVDDDDAFRRVLARALDRRGYAVTVAANVATALARARPSPRVRRHRSQDAGRIGAGAD
jgi:hypothetical protein